MARTIKTAIPIPMLSGVKTPGGTGVGVGVAVGGGVGVAIAAEAARGFDLHGASAARAALLVAACLFGGWLYYLQRAHVVSLVSRSGA